MGQLPVQHPLELRGKNTQRQEASEFNGDWNEYTRACGMCSPRTSVNLLQHVETTFSLDFICTDKSQKTLSQLWGNKLTPSNCLHSTKGVKIIMNHASFLGEHTVLYLSPVCCCVLIATFVQNRLHKRGMLDAHVSTRPLNTYFVGICIAEYNMP